MLIPIGDENPRRTTPIFTFLILAVNVGVWLMTLPMSSREYLLFVNRYGLIPAAFKPDFLSGPVHTIFTSMFLHADVLHLLTNMLFFWITADNVEDRLGHVPFLLFYLVAGIAAAWAHAQMSPVPGLPCIGASGAVAGVLGAYAVFFPRHRIRILYWFIFFIGVLRVPAVFALGLWFLSQLHWGLQTMAGRYFTPVAYWAHVGGFVLGAATALLVRTLSRSARPPAHRQHYYYYRER